MDRSTKPTIRHLFSESTPGVQCLIWALWKWESMFQFSGIYFVSGRKIYVAELIVSSSTPCTRRCLLVLDVLYSVLIVLYSYSMFRNYYVLVLDVLLLSSNKLKFQERTQYTHGVSM
jgi:hypothetical protein